MYFISNFIKTGSFIIILKKDKNVRKKIKELEIGNV